MSWAHLEKGSDESTAFGCCLLRALQVSTCGLNVEERASSFRCLDSCKSCLRGGGTDLDDTQQRPLPAAYSSYVYKSPLSMSGLSKEVEWTASISRDIERLSVGMIGRHHTRSESDRSGALNPHIAGPMELAIDKTLKHDSCDVCEDWLDGQLPHPADSASHPKTPISPRLLVTSPLQKP